MSEHPPEDDSIFIADEPCAICGKPTTKTVIPSVDKARIAQGADREPFVCNKCLIDLRGDMATELEVRRQLGNLEAKVHEVESKLENRLDTRLWVLGIVLAIVLTVAGFFAGAYVTNSQDIPSKEASSQSEA